MTRLIAAIALLAVAGAAHATEITAYSFDNATVQAAGPCTGSFGKTYFNIEGPGQSDQFESFGVLDYGTDGLGLSFAKPFAGDVADIAAISIDLTEGFPTASWYTTGTLLFYVVTDTATSIQPGSTLHCLVGAEDQCGDQLGSKYLLGSGLYETSWGNGAERHNLPLNTVDPAGKQLIIDALNTGVPFRILVQGVGNVGAGLEGQYTYTSGGVSTYLAPMLHLDVIEAVTPPACPADLGVQGGDAGQDGALDNNDFIAFINYFFDNDPHADMGVQGGGFGTDGQFDNNDFIAFINAFFDGCSS